MNENVNPEAIDLGMRENIEYEVAFERLFGRKPTGQREDMFASEDKISPNDLPF